MEAIVFREYGVGQIFSVRFNDKSVVEQAIKRYACGIDTKMTY